MGEVFCVVVCEVHRSSRSLWPVQPQESSRIDFVAPEKVRYKYRLLGFDKDWVDGGDRRVAYYTNLGPGDYRFEVIACINDGVWSRDPSRKMSANSGIATVRIRVRSRHTVTSITSSAVWSTYGDPVTFMASVAAVVPALGTPGGQVVFRVDTGPRTWLRLAMPAASMRARIASNSAGSTRKQ